MKKIVLLVIAIVSVLQASAQEVASLQNHSVAISVDSLTLRLNKLQHDYDFMYCDYSLQKVMIDLKELSQSIDITSNRVIINVYHSRYDRSLYNAYLDHYDVSCSEFDSLKETVETVRSFVLTKIAASDFTELELNVLKSRLDTISKSVSTVEVSLRYYNVTIQAYKSKI